MDNQSNATLFGISRKSIARCAAMAMCLFGTLVASAAPLTINVVGVNADGSTAPVTTAYRWTVEEDATKASVPGKPADKSNYSFSFHTSYMPVVAAGRVGAPSNTGLQQDPDVRRLYLQQPPEVCPAAGKICIDVAKRYYVSVAADGFQMGAAPVVFSNGGATATVYLNKYDLPTAQLSVFAFEDNSPINGAPDLPQETGLAGFQVRLLEAGGTYGQSGGEVTQDAFANPLGTTYNADGSVKVRGAGIILTGPDGTATIKNLFPAKYTVVIVPPIGSDWHQTSTIEGGLGSDAWVKNNEPTFFQEFGPPGHHVFIGFVSSGKLFTDNRDPKPNPTTPCKTGVPGCVPTNGLTGTNTITGKVVNTHHSRPPVYTFYTGAPVNDCWIGLNEANGGRALYAAACNKDSTFTISNVPPGTYEVVVWDTPLDMIIAATTVTVAPGANNTTKAMGNLPVTSWFARYQGRVFQDIDGTGLPFFAEAFNRPFIKVDPVTGLESESNETFAAGALKPSFGEGIAGNIRFRDGSIYQSTTTKQDGTFAFTELFPFFNWMVAEIDYARFKASSATVVVDEGGKIDPAANKAALWPAKPGLFGSNDPSLAYDPWTRLNPQQQPTSETDPTPGLFYRLESVENGPGAVLLEGMQTFLGATNHIEWGKQPYKFNENGGIAGIVHYAITRAEDDPRFAAAENWEPGIPRVQVNLYLDCNGDGVPDKPKNDGTGACESLSANANGYDKPDVDNFPFCWRDPDFVAGNPDLCPNGQAMGPEDIKRSSTGGSAFSYGDVFKWGSPGQLPADQLHTGLGKTDSWDDSVPTGCQGNYHVPSTGDKLDCYDGLRNYNQVRPSVFDGGYAFGRVAGQEELPMFIGTEGKGTYIVEAMAPPGYLHQGNGDKNVVFGDSLKASTAALPFPCVGMELPVPQYLTLFPGEPNPNWEAGQQVWNKCDMKAVPLVPGTNPAPDFYMYTEAPVAGHGVGFILDDTATEFNQFAPTFGEKYSPPHLPVSIQDWTGREISRVYSDQFGSYNFLVPSSFTINPPYPSGVMPSMMVACMNHPGPIADPSDPSKLVIDPYFNRNYTQFCYTLQYLPGKTTYLDTPVLPISAFASVDKNPLDCECADGTPAIYSATNGDNGPWVPRTGGTLTIVSQGKMDVVNPAYDPTVLLNPPNLQPGYTATSDPADPRLQKTIKRDYGFGTVPGTVMLDNTPLTASWSDGVISATIPANAATGQLTIKRGGPNGKESMVGLTVHVGTVLNNNAPKKVNLAGTNGAFKTIQEAIDSVGPADLQALITIAPGTYPEYVIMDKHVSLQGWGAGSVTINAAKSNTGALNAWRALLNKKIDAVPDGTINADTGQPNLVPGSNRTFDILPGQTIGFNAANNEPILFGAEEAPGILVVGRGVSSQLVTGCIPGVTARLIDGLTITGSDSGGGVLASGFACGLTVSNNRVVANYGTYGGGIRIGHTDLTNVVVNNNVESVQFTDAVNRNVKIHHNWVAQNGATEAGGAGGITLGTGSSNYDVSNNYVCGNFSMADGGGLTHLGESGGTNTIANNKFIFNQTFNQSADPTGGGMFIGGQIPVGGGNSQGAGNVTVNANLFQGNQAGAGAGGGVSIARTRNADEIRLTNNMIVNNVAAYAGGGVALTDAGNNVRLTNNTVASNVSTATNRQAFPNPANPSNPQVAGIAVISGNVPQLVNDIIWGNRSYIFTINGTTTQLTDPAGGIYRDLGRIAGNAFFAPVNSVLTDGGTNDHVTASATNIFEPITSTTLFGKKNTFSSVIDPGQPVVLAADGLVQFATALTFDETGNFVNVIFSPLTLWETVPGANFGALRADYHITASSVAKDHGQAPNGGGNSVPARDFDAQVRPDNGAYDIGADEYMLPAVLVVQPSALAFGNQSLNTTVTQTLTVFNTGPVPAPLTAPTLSGANANQFALTNNCTAQLDPESSCTISVHFTPISNGAKVATVTVNSSVGNVTASLSGNGVTPVYTITPVVQNFGNQGTGTSSAPRQFTLTNSVLLLSQGELWLTGTPQMSGTNASQFQAAFRAGDTCTASTHLAVGASCTFSVVFAPTTNGCKGTGIPALCVVPNTTVNVPKASGTGAAAGVVGVAIAPTRTVTPATLATFPTTTRGGTSAAQTVTLTNTGAFAVPFTSATFTGGNAANWAQTNTCGTSIPVGGNCTISVVFKPLAAPALTGAKNATLSIVDGAGTTTRAVNGTAN